MILSLVLFQHLFSDKRLLDLVKSVAGDTACENESTDGNDFVSYFNLDANFYLPKLMISQ